MSRATSRDRYFVAFDGDGVLIGIGWFTGLSQAAREFPEAQRLEEITDVAERHRLLDVFVGRRPVGSHGRQVGGVMAEHAAALRAHPEATDLAPAS